MEKLEKLVYELVDENNKEKDKTPPMKGGTYAA